VRKHSRDIVPLKAKVCTVVSGVVVVASVAFSVYAGFPDSSIPDKDNPLWGILVILVLLASATLLAWGWGWLATRIRSR